MAHIPTDPDAPEFTHRYPNLADVRLGAEAIVASDEFFAPRSRMISAEEPVFIPGKYDDHGKWMDGWETRRRRGPGHDWCIVRLARPGRIFGVDLDTRHFTGNYPPGASLEACHCAKGDPDTQTIWQTLLPVVSLSSNAHHYHTIDNTENWTHIRVSIYPDGGLARLRLYGRPETSRDTGSQIDLCSALNGAYIVATNNEHFGKASSLLLPGRGVNMGDGWETRRRREPGNDWCIVALSAPGQIERVEVDTAHFKGNFPDSCSLQAAFMPEATTQTLITQSMFWPEVLGQQNLSADNIHTFQPAAGTPVTHIRFNIFPDGGVSRLRLFGKIARS